jgi:hypothetical protein
MTVDWDGKIAWTLLAARDSLIGSRTASSRSPAIRITTGTASSRVARTAAAESISRGNRLSILRILALA